MRAPLIQREFLYQVVQRLPAGKFSLVNGHISADILILLYSSIKKVFLVLIEGNVDEQDVGLNPLKAQKSAHPTTRILNSQFNVGPSDFSSFPMCLALAFTYKGSRRIRKTGFFWTFSERGGGLTHSKRVLAENWAKYRIFFGYFAENWAFFGYFS